MALVPAADRSSSRLRQALLAVAMAAAWLLGAAIGWQWHGPAALVVAAVAAAPCYAGAALALMAMFRFAGPAEAPIGIGLAMAARTGLPLLAAVLIHLIEGLDKRGGVYYLLLFYAVAMAVEIPLSLASTRRGACALPSESGPSDSHG